MAGCRIVNAGMLSAVQSIADIAGQYKTAGENFITELNNALSEMEGATKDALKNFIDNDVNQFVAVDLPNALTGMSQLLEANRENFEKVDEQIAQSISGG